MQCYFCGWGWPPEVTAIYKRCVTRLEDAKADAYDLMHFGPLHIIWERENFDDLTFCLENFDRFAKEGMDDGKGTARQYKILKKSLLELAALPDDVRYPPSAQAYEDAASRGHANPADYPPPWTRAGAENPRHTEGVRQGRDSTNAD